MTTVPQVEPEGFDKGRGPVGSPPPGRLLTCPHCPVRVPARVPLSNPGAHAQPARQRSSARMAAVASQPMTYLRPTSVSSVALAVWKDTLQV